MSKVTSKLQVTLPKALAQQYGIRPGDDIEWVAAGDAIRVVPSGAKKASLERDTRLRLFDAATERQRRRASARRTPRSPRDRGWTRQELYELYELYERARSR